jgi:hypothetical protein
MAKKDKKQGFLPQKRKGGGGGKGDRDDIDSKGNIKSLIDYDYDSEDDDYSTETSEELSGSSHGKSPIAHRTRNASKNKLVKKPSKKSKYSDTSSEEEEEEDDRESKLVRKLRNEKHRLEKKLKQKEEEDEEERYAKKRRLRRKVVETEEEEEDEDEEDEEEDEEDDGGSVEEEDEDDEDDEEEEMGRTGGITLSFGIDEPSDRLIPKRHNMKKESEEVKKFVKLITAPTEEDTIDGQIDQFKALTIDQRSKLLNVLETRHKQPEAQQSLMFKLLTMNLPADVQSLVLNKYNALQNLDPGTGEYFKNRNWLEKLTSLPLGIYKDLPVKIADGSETCGAFMEKARRCLDDAIYGQNEAKLQILQFIGTKIANPGGRGLSLLLAGPPGIGKTSLIKNGVAKAIQWPFQFISLGGDSDASTYTGHQLVYESSHCGKIVNSLCSAKSMSMVLMFDELDKISATPKGEEVQNLLVHLTDPVQNDEFEDKYLAGIPIDLSRSMFAFSANYLERIDKVLLDRMTVINLQGYTLKEKVSIAENYILPAALKEVGLGEKVGFAKDVVTYVVENYANEEKGVRELRRCIEQITQKVNMLRMFNTKDLPFHIKDFSLPFVLKKEHIDLFLKRKPQIDTSIAHLYT